MKAVIPLLFASAIATEFDDSQKRHCQNLPSPGAPQLRKNAQRKYFTVGCKFCNCHLQL
jgi:hypothetical protein